ncbi:MAG: helix-turn-helix domain-containing protein [Prevotella sp.]|nr:helix-turn-helix domain-containing protein [Prevotella sp.]
MEKNTELRQAWDFVEHTGRSIFLTGKAGTGKTTFLKTVMERSKKRAIVVAPTGVAAINAGGVTIHSFFQLPLSPFVPNAQIKDKYEFNRNKRKIIASLDLLIIDEISMVRADLLDAIDSVLRRFRDRYHPFGGVQLLMIGDLGQLTPVVTPEDERILSPFYDTPYFFGSKALAQIEYVTIQLTHIYRQQDKVFLDILNEVREGNTTPETLARLNSRCIPSFIPAPEEGYIRLTTHNHLANSYNENELRKLQKKSHYYKAEVKGTFPEYLYPTQETLELKEGAQVMFVKNDPSADHLYYNGRIGRVTSLDQDCITVRCQGDEEDIEVMPLEWENAHYTLNNTTREIETEVQGVFRQYPLRLAWAITIHKSQGLTFDHAIIDANLSFAPGQVYVALSRCRTLEGMVLATPITPHAIINDERVDTYIIHQEQEAQRSIEQLPLLKEEYFRHLLLELYDFHAILYQQESMVRVFTEFFYHSYAQLELMHKQALEDMRRDIILIASKWMVKIKQMPTDHLHDEAFLQRVQKSAEYFDKKLEELFAKPLQLTKEVKTNNKEAMKRLGNVLADFRQAYLSRRFLLVKISEEPFSIPYYLQAKQMSMLDALDEKALKKKKEKKAAEPKKAKEKTWETSFHLYQQGLTPTQIAKQRDLTVGTIFNHLARYVKSGAIPIDKLVPEEKLHAIEQAIQKVGYDQNTTVIKEHCPEDVTYDDIRLVLKIMLEK